MCSLSTGTGAQTSSWRSTISCHQWSRRGTMCTPSPKRSTTMTCSIVGVSATASSAWCLSPTFLPRRQPPSAVTRTFAPQSLMRPDRASAENPPKTTVCGAPMRAHASIAMGSSGIIGM